MKENEIAKIPVAERTKRVCVAAVETDPEAIKYVPERHLSATMVKKAFKRNVKVIGLIPEEFKTPEMCEKAVREDGSLLRYVPENMRTESIVCLAVEGDPSMLRIVPRSKRTEGVYKNLVAGHPEQLANVPAKFRTEAICLKAVNAMDRVGHLVPRSSKTVRLCARVMRSFPELDFTPPRLWKKARIMMLTGLVGRLENVIGNHERIRRMCGYNANAMARARLASELSEYLLFTYRGVEAEIDQDPEFSRSYTYYKLSAYFDGERKDIRAVKKIRDEMLEEIEDLKK